MSHFRQPKENAVLLLKQNINLRKFTMLYFLWHFKWCPLLYDGGDKDDDDDDDGHRNLSGKHIILTLNP